MIMGFSIGDVIKDIEKAGNKIINDVKRGIPPIIIHQ